MSNVYYDEIERRLRERDPFYGPIEERLSERARVRRIQLGTATPEDLLVSRRRGEVLPRSPAARFLESPVGRAVSRAVAGVATGLTGGVLRAEPARVVGREPTEPTTLERGLETVGEMVGYVVGPGGAAFRAVGQAAARAVPWLVQGTPIARAVRQVAMAAGEGAAFGATRTIVDEYDRLLQMKPWEAAAYVARRSGVTSAEWGAAGAAFVGLAGAVRALRPPHVRMVRHRMEQPRLDPDTREVIQWPPPQIRDIYRVEPPQPVQTVRARRAPDGTWTTEAVHASAPPRVSTARQAARAWLSQATPEQVNAAIFAIKAKPEQLESLLKGTRATGTNPRALGLNPRNVAAVAQEMGVSMEEARKAILREISSALRSERGAVVIGPSGLADMPFKLVRRRTDVDALVNLAAATYHDHRSFEAWRRAFTGHINQKSPGAADEIADQLLKLFEVGRDRHARLSVRSLADRAPHFEDMLRMFEDGEGSVQWYAKSGEAVDSLLGGDRDAARFFKASLAVLSEQQSVKGNVTRALQALYNYMTGRDFSLAFPKHQADKLSLIAAGEDPAKMLGRKTYNFFRALDGDPDAVAVDRWMMHLFGLPRTVAPSDTQYDVIEAVIRRWAREAGMAPRDLQAVLWAAVRKGAVKADPNESFASVISRNPALVERVRVFKRIAGVEPLPDVRQVVEGRRDWVIISHDRPAFPDRIPSKLFLKGEPPQAAMARILTSDMRIPSDAIIPVQGVWMGGPPEGGFLVSGLEMGQAIRLARKFGQATIFTPYGELNVHTLEVNPVRGLVFGDDALRRSGYTVVRGQAPFSFDVDYSTTRKLVSVPELVASIRSWRGIMKKAELKALLASERGELGGRIPDEFEVLFDARTGKYLPPPGAAPEVAAFVEELNRQAARARAVHELRTGKPPEAMPPKLDGRRAVEAVEEWATAIKLTNPLTYARNFIANTAAATFAPLEAAVAGTVARRGPREGLEMATGMLAAIPGATRKFLSALKNELTVTGATRNEMRLLEAQGRALERAGVIGGAAGVRIRTPFRVLGLTDEFFRQIVSEGALWRGAYKQAYREGYRGRALSERMADILRAPDEQLLKAAEKVGREYTFTEDIGKFGLHLTALRDTIPGGRLLVPFLKTPINIARFFARRTPAGLLDTSQDAEDRIARALVGSAIGASLVMMAQSGLITGAGPKSRSRRDALYATGWQPYSIRVGDTWVSYRGFEPVGFFLSSAAALVEDDPDEGALGRRAGAMMRDLMRSLADTTFVNSLSDVFDAIAEPDRYLGRYATNLAISATVPAVVSAAARTLDPTVRAPETFTEQLAVRVPGLSQTVRPRVDVFGREVRRGGIALLTPPMSQVRHDPVAEEIVRLGVVLPRPSGRRKDRELDADEVLEIMRRRGAMYYDTLRRLVNSPAYQALPDERRRDVMRRWVAAIVRRTTQ